jgi:hypothetical protein
VKLLMNICFTKTGEVYEPIMVTMSIRRAEIAAGHQDQGASLHETVTGFQIPLITLLPINSLALEEADIKFDMDVHSYHESTEADSALPGSVSASPVQSHQFRGSIKREWRDQSENAGTNATSAAPISIRVSARKLPLPLGVSAIIQAYAKAIHPSDISSPPEDDQQP